MASETGIVNSSPVVASAGAFFATVVIRRIVPDVVAGDA
jgi:hypothetical protein